MAPIPGLAYGHQGSWWLLLVSCQSMHRANVGHIESSQTQLPGSFRSFNCGCCLLYALALKLMCTKPAGRRRELPGAAARQRAAQDAFAPSVAACIALFNGYHCWQLLRMTSRAGP
eukprot:scaffold307811_cov23-Tisochrysis_lutea.AAC.1